MEIDKLNIILEKHKKWLTNENGGERANLRGANLYGADLYGVDLRGANLHEANLREADLREADLYEADLYGADLREANLYGADLYGADLREANLYGADLREANLHGANLCGANLCGANMCGANLREANLHGANLHGANLHGANLHGANFVEDILIAYTNACPQEGSFVAFKKAGGCIVKLLILEDAKRSNATTNKCRCDKAKVLGIYDKEHNLLGTQEVRSDYDHNFIYKVGKIVQADGFDIKDFLNGTELLAEISVEIMSQKAFENMIIGVMKNDNTPIEDNETIRR